MESDKDDVENDFRAMKTSSRKHKPIKNKNKRIHPPKEKTVIKDELCLKLTTKKVQRSSSTRDNTMAENVTESLSSDYKGPQTDASEKEIETSHCPSCGKLFDITKLPYHVKACLHDNFEACKVRQESLGYVQRSAFKSARARLSAGAAAAGDTTSEWSFCTICGTDIFSLTFKQRNTHVNRCLDSRSFEQVALSKPTATAKKVHLLDDSSPSNVIRKEQSGNCESVTTAASQGRAFKKSSCKVKKESKTSKKVMKAKEDAQNEKFRCYMCHVKVYSSRRGLSRHVLHCQKKHKITTACAMALNKPYNSDNDFADDEILSQIRQVENQDNAIPDVSVASSPKVKKKRKIRKMKNDLEAESENMLQLALRVSAGDNLEQKKSKKQKPIRIPAMIELSPKTKRRQLEGRFRSITDPLVESLVEEIPSTPALPRSNLTNSKVHVSHRNQTPGIGQADTDQPETSGIFTRRSGLSIETPSTDINSNSQPSASGTQNTFSTMINEELQSPEVSSSSIKPLSFFQNNDAPKPNSFTSDMAKNVTHHNTRQSTKQRAVKQSNWSLACNKASTSNSDYRVRNLLSQFDKSSHLQDSSHADDDLDIQAKPDVPQPSATDVADVNKEDVADVDHIDSTLAVLRQLDGALPSRTDDDFFEEQISSSQQSESQKLHILIDNPRFSDAKIYVGKKREVINLHKNILYCNCSELLEEINAAEARGDIACLDDYTKREMMPVICFVYSGKIEPLLNAAKRDLNSFAKTKELLKKYAVIITEADQMLLNAAVEQHQIQSQACDKSLDGSLNACQHDESFGTGYVSVKTSGNYDRDDLAFEESDVSFSEELLPQNLTQKEPTHGSSSHVSFDENALQDISDSYPGDYDLFGGYDKSVDDGEVLVDFNNPVFTEDNLESDVSSIQQGEDDVSVSDLFSSSPYKASKNDLVPRAKKRKKHDVKDMTVRKSQRLSLEKSRGWHHRNCFCCSHDNHKADTPKKSRASDKLPISSPNQSLRKSLSSKLPCESIAKQPRTDKMTPRSHKTSMRERRSSSQPPPNPSTIAATPKKQKKLPKSDKPSSVSESATNSCSQESTLKKKTRTGGQHKSQSQTIYIGDRLPRFKQREHIKNRPEVANMGKSTRALARSLNRNAPSSKIVTKKKTYSAIIDSKGKELVDKHGKEENALSSPQHTERHSATTDKLEVEPVAKSNDSSKTICADANSKQSSQLDNSLISPEPKSSIALEGEVVGAGPISVCKSKELNPKGKSPKQYRFRKVHLADYALPSPHKNRSVDVRNSFEDVSATDSDERIEDDLLRDSFVEKFFDASFKSDRMSLTGGATSAPMTPVVDAGEGSLIYVGPVPITPMPDFRKMATPEVLHQASKIGLKKTLSKVKLKAKLEENYLYHHQIEPDISIVNDEVLEMQEDDDDEKPETTVKLTEVTSQTLYSFFSLSVEEIQNLSTAVVERTHKDGALLNAFRQLGESETSKIKRGSRQDMARCLAIITPGGPNYDMKLSAIVNLPDDKQDAITRPLSACVVKNYLAYKKHQFDCVKFLCDEMENHFKERFSS